MSSDEAEYEFDEEEISEFEKLQAILSGECLKKGALLYSKAQAILDATTTEQELIVLCFRWNLTIALIEKETKLTR